MIMLKFFQKKYLKVSIVFILSVSLSSQFIPLPQKVKAETPYSFPDFCNPKVPYYNQPRGESEEFYNACYLLSDIYDAAYNQVEVSRSIGKYTDMFGEYSPFNKCSSRCELSIPGAECEIDLMDILCAIYPPLCAGKLADLWQFIQKVINFAVGVTELADAVTDTVDDLKDFASTSIATWNAFQTILEVTPGIDLSQLRGFAQDLKDLSDAQTAVAEKINKVQIRLSEMRRQVESNLALPRFGFSQEQIRDVFDDDLRNALEKLSETIEIKTQIGVDPDAGPIYDTSKVNKFSQKFQEISDWWHQIEYLIDISENLTEEEKQELIEEIRRLEEKAEENVDLLNRCEQFPEQLFAQTLKYLAHLKENGIFEILENLNSIQASTTAFSTPSGIEPEVSAEIEQNLTSTTQNISETKPSIEIIVNRIQTIETISGTTTEYLAANLDPLVEEIETIISKQISGEQDKDGNITKEPIITYLKEIYGPAGTKNPGADFQAKFDQFDNLASSTQELIRNTTYLSGSQKNDLIAKLDETREIASTTKTLVPDAVEAIGKIKDIEEPTTGKILRYLSKIKPYITPLFQKLQTLETKIGEFREKVESLYEVKKCKNSPDGTRCGDCAWCKGGKCYRCYWKFTGNRPVHRALGGGTWDSCNLNNEGKKAWTMSQGDAFTCYKSGMYKDSWGVMIGNTVQEYKCVCEETIEKVSGEGKEILAKIDTLQSKFDEINTPVKEIHNRIQTIETESKMEISEVAYLFETLDEIDEVIKKLNDVIDKVNSIDIGLDTTEAKIEEQCNEIRNDLTEIQLLLGPYFCATQPDNAYAGGCHYCKDKKCVKYYWDCTRIGGWGPSGKQVQCNPSHEGAHTYTWHAGSDCSRALSTGNYPAPFTSGFSCDCRYTQVADEDCGENELLVALKHFGVGQDYITETRSKIGEAKKPIDELEKAAKKAMGVMNALIAIVNIQDVIDGVKKLKILYKKIVGGCLECKEGEECPGGESCEDVTGKKETCKEGEKCEEGDIKRVVDAWNNLFSGDGAGPGGSGCRLTGNFLDYCKELPSRGVYGDRSSRLFVDLDPLRKQVSDDYGKIKAKDIKIKDLRALLQNTGKGEVASKIKNTVERKAEDIWEKSMWLNVFVNVLSSTADRSTCGKSNCKALFCLPAIADFVGWDCDWTICTAFNHETESIVDEDGNQIEVCKIKSGGDTIKFWQGKKNGKCEIPTIDVFNHYDNWIAWLLSWLITKEGGLIDVLEQEIK